MLCGQCISMTIYDKEKDKMVVFNSTSDFTSRVACEMESAKKVTKMIKKMEKYTNNDYNHFAANSTVSSNEPKEPEIKLKRKIKENYKYQKDI